MNTKHPIGARVMARWNDPVDSLPFPAYISFGEFDAERNTDSYGVNDDTIIYYVNDESELRSFMKQTSNPDDFWVLDYELVYERNGQ